MATKHEPQPWDMYRTQTGAAYIVTMLYQSMATPCVEYIDMDGDKESLTIDQCQGNEFVGNVLALPQLIAACDEAMNALVACAVPGPGCDDKQALSHSRATLYAALLKAGIKH